MVENYKDRYCEEAPVSGPHTLRLAETTVALLIALFAGLLLAFFAIYLVS